MNHIKYEMMCWDEMIPEQQDVEVERYEVEYHHDVWGSRQDGWTVNDSMKLGIVGIPVSANFDDIIPLMQEARFLSREFNAKDYCYSCNLTTIDIDDKETGRPVFTLHLLD